MFLIGQAIWCRRFEPGLLQVFFTTWRSKAFVLNFLSINWEGRRSRDEHDLDERTVPTGGCTHAHNRFATITSWTLAKTSTHAMHKYRTLTARLSKSRHCWPETVVSTLLQRLASKKRQLQATEKAPCRGPRCVRAMTDASRFLSGNLLSREKGGSCHYRLSLRKTRLPDAKRLPCKRWKLSFDAGVLKRWRSSVCLAGTCHFLPDIVFPCDGHECLRTPACEERPFLEVLFLRRRGQRWRSRLSLDWHHDSGGLHLLVMDVCTLFRQPWGGAIYEVLFRRMRYRLSLDCSRTVFFVLHLSSGLLRYLCNFLQCWSQFGRHISVFVVNTQKPHLSATLVRKTKKKVWRQKGKFLLFFFYFVLLLSWVRPKKR